MDNEARLKEALEEKFGLRNVRSEWIRRQTALSADIVAGPICRADICEITEGTLPWNVPEAHSVQLNTKALVQIEDVINIASADPRSKVSPMVLQLTLTDGCTDFVAVELEPLQRISMLTVPGTKMVLHPTALVRRGRVFLTAKDFTFLGPPSSNIWGNAYDEKIASALSEAGLPNSKASTFDSITRNAAQNGAAVRVFPDLGGISDAANLPRNDNDDDDDEDNFWAQVAQLADRSEVNTVPRRETPHQRNDSRTADRAGQATVSPGPLPTNSLPRFGAPRNSSPSMPADTAFIANERLEPIIVDDASDDDPAVMDIPEMPFFDSDAAALDDDFETTTIRTNTISNKDISTEVDDFKVPDMPLSRLEDLPRARDARVQNTVYRAFVTKPVAKRKPVQHEGGLLISVPFDDGTAIENLIMDDNVVKRLTGADFRCKEPSQAITSGSEDSRGATKGSRQLHKYARGITGFIQVHHDTQSPIAGVSSEPPGGYVSARLK